MAYGRTGVLGGQDITLRVIVTDDTGMPVSMDALPSLYIYDESVDEDTIQSEIDLATYTSATAGPLVPTLVSTGYYTYTYTVPSGSAEGTWHDVWVGTIDTVAASSVLNFSVVAGASIAEQVVGTNKLIVIELDSSIAALTSGDELGADMILGFSTKYSPLYASPTLLRLEAGSWLDYVPDDTLALMLHLSSKEADFITPSKKCSDRMAFARTKFVIYDAMTKLYNMPFRPGKASTGSTGGTKQLGNLKIVKSVSSSTVSQNSSGIDTVTLTEIKNLRNEWLRVVNAGGCIVPGQSLEPTWAIKGKHDPGRRHAGRRWRSPQEEWYPQPVANGKKRKPGELQYRFGYIWPYYRGDW